MIFKKSLDKLKSALQKTRKMFTSGIVELFQRGRKIDDDFLEELEEKFIMSDVGVGTTEKIIDALRNSYKNKEIQEHEQILNFLKEKLCEQLTEKGNALNMATEGPTVILVAGVNGVGKTTSIAKLAYFFAQQEKKVLLGASDTFRAAAIDQLEKWANRLNIGIVKQQMGSDPAAVAYDALEAALAREADVLIVDTAGRLHTQKNLMQELEKISRVLKKKVPDAPHEVLLVLDATSGQNAITQAKLFSEAIEVTGIFLTKLDGTAKGGVAVAIHNQLHIPVKFIGLGEQYEDIEEFNGERFVDALLS